MPAVSASVGPRLSPRSSARTGLVREVPPARRPPGAAQDRPGLDRARPPARGLRDQAARGGVAARRARPGPPRHRCRGWCAPARRSPTRPPSSCATPPTSATASRRRCATTARSSRRTSCRASARERIEDITPPMIEEWRASFGPASGGAHEEQVARRPARRLPARADGLGSCRSTRSPGSRSTASARAATSTSSRRRRCWRSSARPATRRTPRSTSRRRSPGCVAASCSRCAGATWTSRARRSRVRASFAGGQVTSPKSGKVRSVPMAPDVATALAGARPARALDRRRRPRLRRHRRRPRRRVGAAAPLHGRAAARRPAAAALP